MKWRGREESQNVEVRRGMGPRTAVGGGLGLLIVIVVGLIFGPDAAKQFMQVEQQMGVNQAPQEDAGPAPLSPEDEERLSFVKVVLRDTEKVWGEQFEQMGMKYREPKMVVFHDAVESACGLAQSAVGPFYCPADEQIYIDLSFFDDLAKRHHAAGDFAQAYVIAHEVAHHVQKLLGYTNQFSNLSGRLNQNEQSVRVELQADFLAGVWAHHAERNYKILEAGDIEEALNAASQIGDDRLQLEATGRVRPDAFTHGTSEQRMRWFRKGLTTGDIDQGDTFNAKTL